MRGFDPGLIHPEHLVVGDAGDDGFPTRGKERESVLHCAGGSMGAVPGNQSAARRGGGGRLRRNDEGATGIEQSGLCQETLAHQRAAPPGQDAEVGHLHVVGKDLANPVGKA